MSTTIEDSSVLEIEAGGHNNPTIMFDRGRGGVRPLSTNRTSARSELGVRVSQFSLRLGDIEGMQHCLIDDRS